MLPKNGPPTHPGEIIRDTIGDMEMTQEELAKRLDVSLQTVNTLINGKRSMTASIAVRLAKVFDTSPQVWMNMQTNLDLWLALHERGARRHG